MTRLFVSMLPLAFCSFVFADDANWSGAGDGLIWEDSDNWTWNFPGDPLINDYPGSESSPGNINVRIAPQNGSDLAVSLNESLNTMTVLRDLRFDAGQGPSTLEVNLMAGSEIIATEIGNTLLSINEGGGNSADSIARLNIAGSLTIGQIRMSRDSDGLTSELNILPEGNLLMTGGGHFVMRSEVATGTSIFRMTGGTFSSGGSRNLEMGSHDSQVLFSGDALFDGSNLTLLASAAGDSYTDKTSLVSVTGSDVQSVLFKSIQGWNASSNPEGASTFQFVTDFSGVTPMTVLGDVDLVGNSGGGDLPADLVVDLTSYSSTDDLVLFDLTAGSGTVVGQFGSVTLVSGTGTIDYAYNGGTQVALVDITNTGGQLMITTVEKDGEDIVLKWNDPSPNSYILEMTTDLSNSDWVEVTDDASNGTYTDLGALLTDSRRFYRLR